jgi:dolichol phosphate-mannose mannosyltransferase
VMAVLGAGFHQLGLVFALLAAGLAFQAGGRRALARSTVGMAVTSVVVVLPIVLLGAFIPMVIEVLLVTALVPEGDGVPERIKKFTELLSYASVLVLPGLLGILSAAVIDLRRTWWIAVGSVWYVMAALFLDLDGHGDIFALAIFLGALGFGLFCWLFCNTMGKRVTLTLMLVPIAFNSVISPLPQPPGGGEKLVLNEQGLPSIQYIYWHKIQPTTCHYRLSKIELNWMKITNGDFAERECGRFDEVWRALEYRPPEKKK